MRWPSWLKAVFLRDPWRDLLDPSTTELHVDKIVREPLGFAGDRGPRATATDLTRHQLGSIDLSDIPELPEGEALKNYNGQVSAFFALVAEPEIKRLIQVQLEFIGREAQTWEQVLVGRGTINGLYLLLERWEKAHKQHLADSRGTKPEPFDKHHPLSEL